MAAHGADNEVVEGQDQGEMDLPGPALVAHSGAEGKAARAPVTGLAQNGRVGRAAGVVRLPCPLGLLGSSAGGEKGQARRLGASAARPLRKVKSRRSQTGMQEKAAATKGRNQAAQITVLTSR